MRLSDTNYILNLTRYWQQYYPDWSIPDSFQVHHIKPRSTFENKNDPMINHPKNLIALHPDDHCAIHKCRGDKNINGNLIKSVKGRKITDQTRKKMSKAQTGRIVSESTRKKIGKASKGRKHSAETRKKISDAGKRRTHSEETRKKIAEANRGKSKSKEHIAALIKSKQNISEESRLKMSISARNKPPITEETRQKLRDAAKRRNRKKQCDY